MSNTMTPRSKVMFHLQGKTKKGLITKTWERCKSIGRGGRSNNRSSFPSPSLTNLRSKSWPSLTTAATFRDDDDDKKRSKKKRQVAPEGCFSVYVGPERQRFVIRAEYANHPLFKMLLEEAESEYGYSSQGPLTLPCDVHFFYKVLIEMDRPIENATDDEEADHFPQPHGCAFGKRSRSYNLLSSSSPLLALNHF
ncbi:auxin-responsive protein SAUR32 [Senna tora]|uniref:Auxin-responsive protein SAUR32 n=1 Tax=Senna tora TaxID=362788 RepID=A0A834X703_9FABA|nr:auxin-responsive protein SAUR32 [Senna tora]